MLNFSFLLTLLTLLVFFALMGIGALRLRRDIIFLSYCCIALLYTVLIPTLSVFYEPGKDLVVAFYEAMSILFFVAPLFIAYKACPNFKMAKPVVDILNNRLVAFEVLLLLFTTLFLYITITNGVFFRRIGHEFLAKISLEMPLWQLIISRFFEESAIFISLVIHIMLRFSRKRLNKMFVATSLVFIFSMVMFFLINSRMQILILILSHFIVFFVFNRVSTRLILSLVFLVFLSFWLVLFARGAIVAENFDIALIGNEVSAESSIVTRLDGIKLLVDLDEQINDKGFMYGESWANPVLIYYYLVFDKVKYEAIKRNMNTTSKVAIYKHYSGKDIVDSPSSIVSDIYPNFGVVGLAIAGLSIGFYVYMISFSLQTSNSLFLLLLALYSIPLLFQLEKEFISLIILFLKYSITLIGLYVLKPFSLKRLRGTNE